MLNKIAVILSKHLLSHNTITEELFEIYVYGFELLISSLMSTSIVLIVGMLLRRIPETIIFLITFVLLRSFTGGYHANSYLLCTLVTFLSYGFVLFLSEFIKVSINAYIILALAGLVLLLKMAPVEHPNKKLSFAKKRRFKIISIIIFAVIIIVGIYIKINCDDSVAKDVIFFALLADFILLFIKNRKERRLKNEIV